jgi:hypothetical protein
MFGPHFIEEDLDEPDFAVEWELADILAACAAQQLQV